MVFGDFKTLLSLKAKGDRKFPTETNELNLLIKESIERISDKTIPLDLVETDLDTYSPYRFLNPTQFIRKSNDIEDDTSLIDIDEELEKAVLYDMLGMLLSDIQSSNYYSNQRDITIEDYEWNNYKLLQNIKDEV